MKLIDITKENNVNLENVYDLEVEDEHEYFANGILVSNSHADNYSKVGFDRLVNTEREISAGSINQGSGIGSDTLEQIRRIENTGY